MPLVVPHSFVADLDGPEGHELLCMMRMWSRMWQVIKKVQLKVMGKVQYIVYRRRWKQLPRLKRSFRGGKKENKSTWPKFGPV